MSSRDPDPDPAQETCPLSQDGEGDPDDGSSSSETGSFLSLLSGRIPVLGHVCMGVSCVLVTVIACYVKVIEVSAVSFL